MEGNAVHPVDKVAEWVLTVFVVEEDRVIQTGNQDLFVTRNNIFQMFPVTISNRDEVVDQLAFLVIDFKVALVVLHGSNQTSSGISRYLGSKEPAKTVGYSTRLLTSSKRLWSNLICQLLLLTKSLI